MKNWYYLLKDKHSGYITSTETIHDIVNRSAAFQTGSDRYGFLTFGEGGDYPGPEAVLDLELIWLTHIISSGLAPCSPGKFCFAFYNAVSQQARFRGVPRIVWQEIAGLGIRTGVDAAIKAYLAGVALEDIVDQRFTFYRLTALPRPADHAFDRKPVVVA